MKDVQRPVARDILRKRGIDPAQATAMTREQLAYRLAELTPPRRAAAEAPGHALEVPVDA